MALLKRKQEKTGIASIRLPMSAIQELQTLRQLADGKGYDSTPQWPTRCLSG